MHLTYMVNEWYLKKVRQGIEFAAASSGFFGVLGGNHTLMMANKYLSDANVR